MLYAFPADRTGCGFYRVAWPLGELRDRVPLRIVWPGEDVPLKAEVRQLRGDKAPSVKAIDVPSDCSAVLLQRPTSVLLVQCIPFLIRRGIKVIVEIDDDLHSLTPRHAAYKAFNKPSSASPLEPVQLDNSLDALREACALADLVICSTPALLERYCPTGAGGRGVVLRNRLRSDFRSCLKKKFPVERTTPSSVPPRVSPILSVPELPLPVTRTDELAEELLAAVQRPVDTAPATDELRVGWAGVITTHPDDLAVLSRALPRLPIDNFHIVGPVPDDVHGGLQRAERLLGINNVTFTGSVPFADWLPHLSQSLDIALAPLEDNRFNLSKSWLKPLEYAACGIPCISSNTSEYLNLGVGLFASNSYKDWYRQLRTLISSPALREELVGKANAVADANTYANFADEWYDAISPLVDGAS